MTRRVDYHELFDCDVRDAAAWLDSRIAGTGAELSRAVEQQILQILENPQAYREVRPGIRRAVLKRFRYILVYRLKGDDIRFVGFIHGRRDLSRWFESRQVGG